MLTKSEPLLSIGMIAKNNEATITKCLDAINHLRDTVPCQLICADTGSTDRTPEILKQYADIYLEIPWNNDFAAARNETLKPATGKWFLFFDTDEIFLDTKEIEEFFLSGDYKHYGSAFYTIRNYTSPNRDQYVDFFAFRLSKRHTELHFVDTIHEHLDPEIGERKFLRQTMAMHNGYLHTVGNDTHKKAQRNLDLLFTSLEKAPHDMKLHCHIIRQYSSMNQYHHVLTWCQKALDLWGKYETSFSLYCYAAEMQVRGSADRKQYALALDTIENYKKEKKKQNLNIDIVSDLDFSYLEARLCYEKENFIQAYAAVKRYLRLYPLYHDGTLATGDLLFNPPSFDKKDYYNSMVILGTMIQNKLDGWKKAKDFFYQYFKADDSIPELKNKLSSILAIIGNVEEFDAIKTYYQRHIVEEKEKSKKKIAIQALENFLATIPMHRQEIYNMFVTMPVDQDIALYKTLLQLRTVNPNDTEKAVALLEACQNKIEQWEPYYSDLIYYSFSLHQPMTYYYETLTQHEAAEALSDCILNHIDFIDLIRVYLQSVKPAETVFEHLWQCYLLESMLYQLTSSEAISDADYEEIFQRYLSLSLSYAKMMYKPELLTLENPASRLLPNQFRLALLLKKADQTEDCHEKMQLIKKALSGNEKLLRIFNILLTKISQQINQTVKLPPEFLAYAEKIKGIIHQMILSGELNNALQALKGYEQVNPTDPEIQTYRRLIEQALTPHS